MNASEKLAKVSEMLKAKGVEHTVASYTKGGGVAKCKVKGKAVEVSVSPEAKVETSKYAHLLPDGMFMELEAL